MRYAQHRFWSVMLGGPAARLSMYDSRGCEYYAIVPDRGGAAWRAEKEATLNAIADAIESGAPPGAAWIAGNQWSKWIEEGVI